MTEDEKADIFDEGWFAYQRKYKPSENYIRVFEEHVDSLREGFFEWEKQFLLPDLPKDQWVDLAQSYIAAQITIIGNTVVMRYIPPQDLFRRNEVAYRGEERLAWSVTVPDTIFNTTGA